MQTMPLESGDRLGPYEVVSLLGTGGMGEVYRARDTRLNRNVAIKLLRGGLDAGAQARFQREAEVVASLNHPNIVALYEIGTQGAVEYTVSELVEGESLRAVLAQRGALPVRQSVDIATQMADGLAAAHAAGIVHRDLKPENVMLTRDGRVKILDFGLARQHSVPTFGSSGAHVSDETIAVAMPEGTTEYRTHAGMVLGTASYMSPEQARGEDVDYRSDQFSLGLVLYEMLAGKQPFARPSAVETMAAIVREDPPPLPETLRIPAPLQWTLERLLEKERDKRFDSTRDLYQQLRAIDVNWSSANSSSSLAPAKPAKKTSKLAMPLWLGIASLAVGLAAGAAGTWLVYRHSVDLSRYHYMPFAMNTTSSAYFSHDGHAVLYSARVQNLSQIFLVENGGSPRQLTQMEDGGSNPLGFDDDQAHVLFIHRAASTGTSAVYSISRTGGTPQHLIDIPDSEHSITLSPDGKTIAVLAAAAKSGAEILSSSPVGAPWKHYAPDEITRQTADIYNSPLITFSPDGKKLLVIVDGSNVREFSWIVPWPATNDTHPKQVDLKLPRAGFTPQVSWMPDGRRIIFSSAPSSAETENIYAGAPGGPYTQVTTSTNAYVDPHISPDSSTMAFVVEDSDLNIVALSVADGTPQTIVSTVRDEFMPAWSSRAGVMTYVTNRNGPSEIWAHTADGTDRRVITLKDMPAPTEFFMTPVPSPDGSRIAFVGAGDNSPRLYIVPMAGGTPVRATDTQDAGAAEFSPNWAPDGSHIVYEELLNGRDLLTSISSDGTATPKTLYESSTVQFGMPVWTPDGKHILFPLGDSLNSLPAEGGKPQVVAAGLSVNSVAIAKDGSTVYGIRSDAGLPVLFSMDTATWTRHDIKQLTREWTPASNLNPGTLVTLSPDGKLLTFATRTARNSIWTLTGFPQ